MLYMTAKNSNVFCWFNLKDFDAPHLIISITILVSHVLIYLYFLIYYRDEKFGGRAEISVLEKLKQKQAEYAERDIEVLIEEDPLCVAMITPLMRRAHQVSDISDICFIDSSGSCDQTATVTTFLYGHTKVGGIPLGVVFHRGQSEENYTVAFSLLKKLLGPDAFNKHGHPQVIMTDDSRAEKNALKIVFPESTQLLCFFHVLQALWRWLWDSSNKISKEHRPHLIRLVKNMMFAKNEIDFEIEVTAVSIDNISEQYPKFISHVDKLLLRKKEWCICFRENLTTRGHNTNNIVEASIRIFKDCILIRCKAYNMVSLLHFIAYNLENYHTRRLLSFAGSRKSQPQLVFNSLAKRAKNLDVTKINDNEYHVQSESQSNVVYQVYTDIEQCTCYEGIGGNFCKHLCAVQLKYQLQLNHSPNLTTHDKKQLAILAVGGNNIDLSFFESMDIMSNDTENNTECDYSVPISNSRQTSNDFHCSMDRNESETEENDKSDALKELKNHLARLSDLATSSTTSNIRKLCSKLNKIQSNSQFDEFCNTRAQNYKVTNRISVQPTAVSRRKKRPGFTSGALRMQAGRPAIEESGPPLKKRKRNLGLSISENRPNAKSHGKNH